jgi:hypothetical protein
MIDPAPKAAEIAARQTRWTAQWHEAPPAGTPSPALPWSAIEGNHRMNFELWHAEDAARRDDLGAEHVRSAKRLIDRCNQARNDAVEAFDAWLLAQLPAAPPAAPLHSETPGMIIDRLSILALKVYHMRIEAVRVEAGAEQRRACEARCSVLTEQQRDLEECLDRLFTALARGQARFKLYRQFKMYNDPGLNPELYSR